MNNAETWFQIIAGVAALGWILRTELTIRNLQRATTRQKEMLDDVNIRQSVAAVTDSELDALLSDHIGAGTSEVPAKPIVSESGSKGKN